MFSCLICSKKFGTIMERAKHVSDEHMDDDMSVTLLDVEVPLLQPGEMVMPLTSEQAMGWLKGALKNKPEKLMLCENCAGCEVCSNTWEPKPTKRSAQDTPEAGPSKKAMDDYWFCCDDNGWAYDPKAAYDSTGCFKMPLPVVLPTEVFASQDDEWLCAGAKEFDSQDDGGLRRAVNAIAAMDPTQTMQDFWATMDEMARVDYTPEEEAEVPIEQIGGALGNRVSCPICALVFTNVKHMNRHKIFAHGNMFCPRCGQKFKNRTELMIHRRVCNVRGLPTDIPRSEFFHTEIFTALTKSVVTYCFKPKVVTDALVLCLAEFEGFVTPILDNYTRLCITFKVDVSCQVTMHKLTDVNTKINP